MASTKSLKGPDLKVYINGRQEIPCIDRSTPIELPSGMCTIKGTMEIMRFRNSGGLQGVGIAAPEDRILLERYFSLTVVDRVSDKVILQIDEASVTEESWQTGAKGMVSGTFSFQGRQWTNDAPS